LVQMEIYGKLSQMNPVYKEFVEGGSLSEKDIQELNSIKWLTKKNYKNGSSFSGKASQVSSSIVLIKFVGFFKKDGLQMEAHSTSDFKSSLILRLSNYIWMEKAASINFNQGQY